MKVLKEKDGERVTTPMFAGILQDMTAEEKIRQVTECEHDWGSTQHPARIPNTTSLQLHAEVCSKCKGSRVRISGSEEELASFQFIQG